MNYKNKYVMFAIIILIISLFTSTCYAKFSDIPLTTYAYTNAEMDSVFIKDISITDNVNADISNSEIINFTKTMMYSKVTLSDTDINSTLTMTLSIYNYGTSVTTFEKVLTDILDNSIYSNSNIDYALDGLNITDQVSPKDGITFTITFKYSSDYINSMPTYPLDNTLTSYINFKFGHDFVTKFNSNLGECESINDYYVEYGQPLLDLDNELPTRTGYIFMGWFDNKDYLNGNMFYDEEQERLDLKDIPYDKYTITLYAGWKPIEYTITYHNSILPNEYQEIEYIESTNGQYIDTNYYFTGDIIEIETEIYAKIENKETDIIGNQAGSNAGRFVLGIYNSQIFAYSRSQTISENNVTSPKYTDYQHLYIDCTYNYLKKTKTLIVNDTSTSSPQNASTSNDIKTLKLFQDGNNSYKLNARMYYLKIYADNILVRDFIPCINSENDKVGLYDLVNNIFYPSATNDNFIAGNIINNENTKTQKITYDKETSLQKNSWNKSNYEFLGWSTSKENDTIINYQDEDKIINLTNIDNDNIDLYAIWGKTINITFKSIYTSFEKEITITDKKEISDIPDIIINYKNYTLSGWYDEHNIKYFDSSGKFTGIYPKKNITLYDKYQKAKLPDEYQEVEYIESFNQAYIDTLYYQSSNKLEIDTLVELNMEGTEKDILGNQDGTNGRFVFGFYGNQVFAYSRSNLGSDNNVTSSKYYDHQILSINCLYDYDKRIKTLNVNNNITTNTQNQSISNNLKTIKIFQDGNNGNYLSAKLYYLKIIDNDVVIFDLIPCYNKQTKEVGLYNIINNTFYNNTGSGSFIAGLEIN